MVSKKKTVTAFFDIETAQLFDDVHPGFSKLPFPEKEAKKRMVCQKIGLATACIITDEPKPQVFIFDQGQEKELMAILQNFEKIVGHNLLGFDYLVLEKYTSPKKFENLKKKTIDTLDLIRSATNGQWTKLDELAKLNLGQEKSEDSLKIPSMWRAGKKDQVRAYCKNDVELLRDLYLLGKKNNKVKYYHKNYGVVDGIREVAVDW